MTKPKVDYLVTYPCAFVDKEAVSFHTFSVDSIQEALKFVRGKSVSERNLCRIKERIITEIPWREAFPHDN